MIAASEARDRAVDLAFAAGWRLLRSAPAGFAAAGFARAADLATRCNGPGVARLRANLARVVPDARPEQLDVLVRDGMRSYARYWCEAFRLPSMDHTDLYRRTTAPGREFVTEAMSAGRGLIFAVPHSGNYDAAGVFVTESLRSLGLEPVFTTVVERLRPESVYRRFVGFRESLGFEVLTAGDGSAVYRGLTRRLKAGGVVCLVSDRDLTATGTEVSLFGEKARMPTGPARLAAMTGAMLLPALPSFVGAGWGLPMGPPIPVPDRASIPEATQALADAFTAQIRSAPADWHMLQPIFTADTSLADVGASS